MRRNRNLAWKLFIGVILLLAISQLYITVYRSFKPPESQSWSEILLTPILIENPNSIMNLTPFVSNDQNRLYLKYKQHKILSRAPKIYLKNVRGSSVKRGFFVITEYTTIFGDTKYCQMHKDTDLVRAYVNEQRIGYHVLERLFENNEKLTLENRYDLLDKCAYKNCYFTCDKSMAPAADALLFHLTDLEERVKKIGHVDDYAKTYEALFGFKRPSKQVWMLWNDEANVVSPIFDMFEFNWTISYNSESEASYCSYGCVVHR